MDENEIMGMIRNDNSISNLVNFPLDQLKKARLLGPSWAVCLISYEVLHNPRRLDRYSFFHEGIVGGNCVLADLRLIYWSRLGTKTNLQQDWVGCSRDQGSKLQSTDRWLNHRSAYH
ncbi:hypothetical protein YC2023_080183 [Brassica napus]